MSSRKQPSPPAGTENVRSLVRVKVVRVEAVAVPESNKLEILVDSGVALYRFSINPVQALTLTSALFHHVAERALHSLMKD